MKKLLIGALMLTSLSSFAQEYEIVFEYDSTQNISINTDNTEESNVDFGIDCYVKLKLPDNDVTEVKVLTYDYRNERILIHHNSDSEAIDVISDTDKNGNITLYDSDLPLLKLKEKFYSRLTSYKGYDLERLEGFGSLKIMNEITICVDTYKF